MEFHHPQWRTHIFQRGWNQGLAQAAPRTFGKGLFVAIPKWVIRWNPRASSKFIVGLPNSLIASLTAVQFADWSLVGLGLCIDFWHLDLWYNIVFSVVTFSFLSIHVCIGHWSESQLRKNPGYRQVFRPHPLGIAGSHSQHPCSRSVGPAAIRHLKNWPTHHVARCSMASIQDTRCWCPRGSNTTRPISFAPLSHFCFRSEGFQSTVAWMWVVDPQKPPFYAWRLRPTVVTGSCQIQCVACWPTQIACAGKPRTCYTLLSCCMHLVRPSQPRPTLNMLTPLSSGGRKPAGFLTPTSKHPTYGSW